MVQEPFNNKRDTEKFERMPNLKLHDEIAVNFMEWAHLSSLTIQKIKEINEIADSPKKYRNKILRCYDKLQQEKKIEGRDIESFKRYCMDRNRMDVRPCQKYFYEIIKELYGNEGVKIAVLRMAIRYLRNPFFYWDITANIPPSEMYKNFFRYLEFLEKDFPETKDVKEYFKKNFVEIIEILKQRAEKTREQKRIREYKKWLKSELERIERESKIGYKEWLKSELEKIKKHG